MAHLAVASDVEVRTSYCYFDDISDNVILDIFKYLSAIELIRNQRWVFSVEYITPDQSEGDKCGPSPFTFVCYSLIPPSLKNNVSPPMQYFFSFGFVQLENNLKNHSSNILFLWSFPEFADDGNVSVTTFIFGEKYGLLLVPFWSAIFWNWSIITSMLPQPRLTFVELGDGTIQKTQYRYRTIFSRD